MRAFSIRSKVLLMLIVSGLFCVAAVGLVADIGGQAALTQSVTDQLTQLRDMQRRAVERYFNAKLREIRTVASMPVMTEGVTVLAAAFNDFADQPDAGAVGNELAAWYRTEFLPDLARFVDGTPSADNYMPPGSAGQRLQRDYSARNPYPTDDRPKLDRQNNGTYSDLLHGIIHPAIREIAARHGFDDVLLVEPKSGDVVYNLSKQIDLGVNLRSGPSAQTGAARAFAHAMELRDAGSIWIEDFSAYAPDRLRPTAFIATPLHRSGELVGVLIIQASDRDLNALMTNAARWEEIGLRKTGEVYLVGPDLLMRSDSRFFLENPEAFLAEQAALGVAEPVLRRLKAYGSSILLQSVDTEGSRAALRGETGSGSYRDYRGHSVLSAWTMITLQGLRFGVVAKMDTAEALAPVREFHRSLALIAAAAVVVLTIGSLIAAGAFAGPLRRLMDAANRLASGDDMARAEVASRDEFGELARGFNQMADAIGQRNAAIEAKTQEYENLLRNVYPDIIADRMRQGEVAISETLQNVSLIVIAIDGLNDPPTGDAPATSLARLNELVDALDEAALRIGVEKIKTLGETYIAACGLSVARLDHARRALAFIEEAGSIVARLSNAWGDNLDVRASIVSGEVEAGLVGRHRTVYDIWGPNFLAARRIVFDTKPGHVRVTDASYGLIAEHDGFVAMPPLELPGHHRVGTWQRPVRVDDHRAEAA